MKQVFTLCLIYQPPKVLLGMKKRGFGAKRWNGFGGKVENGEIIEESLKREVKEEAGITPENIEKVGVIDFNFRGKPEILEVHFFKASEFIGKLKESEEMKPKWFDVKEIPFNEMWPDDKYWLPLLLEGKRFKGVFHFDESDNIFQHQLNEVKLI